MAVILEVFGLVLPSRSSLTPRWIPSWQVTKIPESHQIPSPRHPQKGFIFIEANAVAPSGPSGHWYTYTLRKGKSTWWIIFQNNHLANEHETNETHCINRTSHTFSPSVFRCEQVSNFVKLQWVPSRKKGLPGLPVTSRENQIAPRVFSRIVSWYSLEV